MNAVVYAGLISFCAALALGPSAIGALRRLRAGQHVREDGPKRHAGKAGTPTMGGVIIVLSAAVATFLFATPGSPQAGYLLMALFGFALVGLVDDFIIVVAKRSLGLKARHKIVAQVVISAVIALYVLAESNGAPTLVVPFLSERWAVHPVLFLVLAPLTMIAGANAVNITDGLDGLAAGAAAIAAAVLSAVAFGMGEVDIAVFAAALCGGCLGFSWYNAHPAQVFMGDTGSLALGGALGAIAVLTGTELILVIIGGLFVVETLSVMIQVFYFKATGGKRIFRMSPIHHHFELGGWAEPQIVTRFWVVALVFGLIGLMAAG